MARAGRYGRGVVAAVTNRLAFHVLHASIQTDVLRAIRQMTATIAPRTPQSRTRAGDPK